MKELKFIQLEKGNEEHFKSAKSVWIPFIHEVNAHDEKIQTEDEIILGLRKRIGIQGSRKDMHFEIAFLDNEVIGIAMFAIDLGTVYGLLEPGYGTIMGFYIKQEYRRRGYGKELYMHIEDILKKDGASKIYICPDEITGVPFWLAIGFKDSEKYDPDDKKPIYIKRIGYFHETISVFTSDYLSHELAEKIALMQWHTKEPQFTNGIKRMIYDGKLFSDCFNVIATNTNDDVVGRLYCLNNQEDPSLWYYGDLAVSPQYRRQHIAVKMLTCAISTLMSRGCHVLRTYVNPENIPSIKLQKVYGFLEKPYKTFDNLLNEGQIMFELELEQYNAVPASVDEARFVTMLYGENQEALHGAVIMFDKWKELLAIEDPDEAHFLICKGAMPCAWLKINGLQDNDVAWISMLAVHPKMQKQGIGKYAIDFSEKYVKEKGFKKIRVHTTEDNIPAQNLYKKCGYSVTEFGDCTTDDGKKRKRYTFEKLL